MPDDADHAADEPARKRLSPVVIVLAVLVLYPLSIGPAAGLINWLGDSTLAGQKVNGILTVFYRPMVWVAEKWPPLLGLIQTYMGWFMR